MTREIKFRVWDKNSKLWVAGWTIKQSGVSSSENDYEWMQYTGLNDKREKEAYFGDLIRWGNSTYLIDWDKENAKTVLLKQNGTEIFNTLTVDQITKSEIIGNIMENPQLKL